MVGLDQPSHWAIIAVAFLLLFGYKKLPDMARSAGRSMRVFKTELKGLNDDDEAREAQKAASTAAPPVLPAPVPPVVPPVLAKAPAPLDGAASAPAVAPAPTPVPPPVSVPPAGTT